MTQIAGQPDDYYHYRVFSEGTITRQEALKWVRDNKVDLSDAFGVCWTNEYGLVQCLNFKEMTDEELDYINCPLEKW